MNGGVRYQAGWFRLNQRNVAARPAEPDDAARGAVDQRQPQDDDDNDARPQADDNAQVFDLLCWF